MVIRESFQVSVGLEWTVLQLCALTALLALLSKERGTNVRRTWLILCGAFMGFAMGTKYPAWLLPLTFLPAMLMKDSIQPPQLTENSFFRLSMNECGLLLGSATLILSPWIWKNIWFYHNPLYPFLQGVFAPNSSYLPDTRQINTAGSYAALLSFRGVLHYLSHPIRFLISAGDITKSTGLFVLIFLPLILLTRPSTQEKFVAWFSFAAWIPLSLLSDVARYFIPHIAPLVLLSCCVASNVQPRRLRNCFMALACALVLAGAFVFVVEESNHDKLQVYAGNKTFGDYLAHAVIDYPVPPFAGIDFLNRTTPDGQPVMFYMESRTFYLKRPIYAASSDQKPLLEVWADQSANPDDLKKRFDTAGIQYILVNLGEVVRRHWQPKLTPHGLMTLSAFWRRSTQRVFAVQDARDRWGGGYKILAENEAAQPHAVDDFFGN